ncbi:sugar phosphate isomerase/epimerase family protein [Vibrio mangrovi]|nr:sugar phosphate isomerase/epimerase [Vibrio mangrovi]
MKIFNKFIKLFLLSCGIMSAFAVSANELHHKDSQRIALQMYTLRNVGTLEEQLAMASRAGYHAIELVGDHGVQAAEMNRLLAKYNIKAISDHVQLAALRNDLKNVIKFNKAISNKIIVMPWLGTEERPQSAEAWREMGRELDKIGDKLRRHGLTLAYHNHNFEMKKYDGRLALEWMLDATSPANLKIEADVAWVFRGGQDPAELIRSLAGRVIAIHVKDNTAIGERNDEGNFTAIGAGDGLLAWDEILPEAQKIRVKWYIVEHDLPKDPETTISTANKYLKEYFRYR